MPPSDVTKLDEVLDGPDPAFEAALLPLAPPAQLLYAGFWLLGPDNNIETISYPVHLRIARAETDAADQPVDWASFVDAAGATVWCQRVCKLASTFTFDPPQPLVPVVVVSIIDGHGNSSAVLTDCGNTSFSFRVLGDATQVSVAVFGQPAI